MTLETTTIRDALNPDDVATVDICRRQHKPHSARHYARGDDITEQEIREGGPASWYYTAVYSDTRATAISGKRYGTLAALWRALALQGGAL